MAQNLTQIYKTMDTQKRVAFRKRRVYVSVTARESSLPGKVRNQP